VLVFTGALLAVACARAATPVVSEVTSPPTSSRAAGAGATRSTAAGPSLDVPSLHTTTTAKPEELGARAEQAMEARLPGFKALRVILYFGPLQRAVVLVQNPTTPANVDQYTYQDGSLSLPVPYQLDSSDLPLSDHVFDPSAVAWDKLGDMMAQAKAGIPIADSKGVTLVVVQRLPGAPGAIVDANVDGGARYVPGNVRFHGDGSLVFISPPSDQ
jgi:hypothetical protein